MYRNKEKMGLLRYDKGGDCARSNPSVPKIRMPGCRKLIFRYWILIVRHMFYFRPTYIGRK